MHKLLKKKIYAIAFGLLIVVGCIHPLLNTVSSDDTKAPGFKDDFTNELTESGWVLNPGNFRVTKDQTLRQNVVQLFYPSSNADGGGAIYQVVRTALLGIMIAFIVRAGASLLFNRKPEDVKKTLRSLVYILLGGLLVYAANWIFGSVLNFNSANGQIVSSADSTQGIGGVTSSLIGEGSVMFVILSALKGFAFFLAIIMTVITGFRVIAAGEGEKGKKLLKGVVNVVVALLVIKGIDFIYYLAADSGNFVSRASDFIINIAKIFGYLYGGVIVIMVFVAGYLYIIDGGSGTQFKKASNILVNILLSALVLFAFLLIVYQIFAEFQTGGDAVTEVISALSNFSRLYV